MHDPNQPGCDESACDLPLRHVPADDRRAPDAASAGPTDTGDGTGPARVQRVRRVDWCDVDSSHRRPRNVKRTGRGQIHHYAGAAGDRFYASIGRGKDSVRLGTYGTIDEAEAAIAAYLRAEDEVKLFRYDEIVESWVEDMCAAFPEEQRREWFGQPWDPIAASFVRMGFGGDMTLDQGARLYGVSRQRIAQVEIAGAKRYAAKLAEYRDYEAAERFSPLDIIEGGVW